MTRKQIRDLIRKRLGETTAAFWLDVELNTWINDAGHDIVFRTKCLKDNGYITTVENTQEYAITDNFPTLLSITEVYLEVDGETWSKLDPTTRTQLDLDNPGWLSYEAGTPGQYYWDLEEDVFGLVVKPDEDNAGDDYIRVYYAKDFVELTDDSQSPAVIEYLHEAFVDYVCAKGFEQRGYGDKGNDAWTKYNVRLRIYLVEHKREREDEEIISRNYKNV